MTDNTKRFSDRVSDYARYRPSYPEELLAELDRVAWAKTSTVVDVGAGTGLFSRLVAARVSSVIALEPNEPMRQQGRLDSQSFANLQWMPGTGESTGLPPESVDALVCAQAFHWLDHEAARREWARILRPGSVAVLIWNERDAERAPFHQEYESLLRRWCPEYEKVSHSNVKPHDIERFFAPEPVRVDKYNNDQRFDLEGWKGRLRSASYCPAPGDRGHKELMKSLDPLFERYRGRDGLLTFAYTTVSYWGRLG